MKPCEVSGIHNAKPPYYRCSWCGRIERPESNSEAITQSVEQVKELSRDLHEGRNADMKDDHIKYDRAISVPHDTFEKLRKGQPLTDTPSTLKDRFIKQFTCGRFKGDVGSNVLRVGDASSIIDFMEQELAAFASEVKKQIKFDMGEPDDIPEEWDNGWFASSKNSIQSIDRILKNRYGLMEGEKV